MKLIGILWNSAIDKKDEITRYIKTFGNVIYYDVDFENQYSNFIYDLYPNNKNEKNKADYKINGLVNQYKNNQIRIMIIDIPKAEKIYLKNKDKMMYKNVLDIKVSLRKKYSYLIKTNNKQNGKTYDNIFHMSDDELEYEKDLIVVLKYMKTHLKRLNGFIKIDDFVDKENCCPEKWGTRNKEWLNKKILFKSNSENTYECFAELFNMYLLMQCNLSEIYYDLANYDGKDGVITFNVLRENEFMVDGSHVMSEDESYTKKELIEHNNLEMLESIIKNWCHRKGYIYNNNIILGLHDLFLYDLLTLQPDRNPSNYAIAINNQNFETRLVYFDNSNMLFCDDANAINLYQNGKFNLEDNIHSLKTFLLLKKENTCFDKKEDLFKQYYELVDNNRKNYIKEMLQKMSTDNLIKIFDIIETERNFTLPKQFKELIISGFGCYHKKLYKIIYEIDKLKNENIKYLQLTPNYNKMGEK